MIFDAWGRFLTKLLGYFSIAALGEFRVELALLGDILRVQFLGRPPHPAVDLQLTHDVHFAERLGSKTT